MDWCIKFWRPGRQIDRMTLTHSISYWWKKSCTSWYVVYPGSHYLQGLCITCGAGFLPSTAVGNSRSTFWIFAETFLCGVYMTSHRKCTAVVVFICSSHFCREKKELPRLGVGKKFHAHLANPKNRNACHPSIDCRTKRLSALERATYGGGAKFGARGTTNQPPNHRSPASVDLKLQRCNMEGGDPPNKCQVIFHPKAFPHFLRKFGGRETSKVGTCCHT